MQTHVVAQIVLMVQELFLGEQNTQQWCNLAARCRKHRKKNQVRHIVQTVLGKHGAVRRYAIEFIIHITAPYVSSENLEYPAKVNICKLMWYTGDRSAAKEGLQLLLNERNSQVPADDLCTLARWSYKLNPAEGKKVTRDLATALKPGQNQSILALFQTAVSSSASSRILRSYGSYLCMLINHYEEKRKPDKAEFVVLALQAYLHLAVIDSKSTIALFHVLGLWFEYHNEPRVLETVMDAIRSEDMSIWIPVVHQV